MGKKRKKRGSRSDIDLSGHDPNEEVNVSAIRRIVQTSRVNSEQPKDAKKSRRVNH
jgi:hypothetical protein